jgi:hypothetical protein
MCTLEYRDYIIECRSYPNQYLEHPVLITPWIPFGSLAVYTIDFLLCAPALPMAPINDALRGCEYTFGLLPFLTTWFKTLSHASYDLFCYLDDSEPKAPLPSN